MYSLQLILLSFLFVIISALIVINLKRYKSASSICAIYVSAILYYCLIPIILYINYNDVERTSFVGKIVQANIWQFLNGWICVLIFILSVEFSHRRSCKGINNKFLPAFDLQYKHLVGKFALFCTIIGGTCFILYIFSFEGINAMLEQSEALRSFSGESNVSYMTKILVFPARLVVLLPCFLVMYRELNKSHKFLYIIFIVISYVFGLLFYLNNAGKTGIAIYFIALMVPILKKYTNSAWKLIIILGLAGASLVGYLDNIFLFFTTGVFYDVEGTSMLDNINQFAYPSSNTMSLEGITAISGYRCGLDFITGLLSQIPGINFPNSFEYTSEFYGGKWWRDGGGTPTDSITFGYMQFSYFGVIIWGLIIGYISGWADKKVKNLRHSFGTEFFKATLILAFFVLTTNSDIYIIVRSQFTLWVPLLFLLLLFKNKINKTYKI